jgi:DNA-directed RNA polymerase subunit N (RpoN/RPB10)
LNGQFVIPKFSTTCDKIFSHMWQNFQPHVTKFSSTCDKIFNHTWPNFQAHVTKFSSTCDKIFGHMWQNFQPHVTCGQWKCCPRKKRARQAVKCLLWTCENVLLASRHFAYARCDRSKNRIRKFRNRLWLICWRSQPFRFHSWGRFD